MNEVKMFLELAPTTETAALCHPAVDSLVDAHVAAIAATLQDGWEIDQIDSDDSISLLLTPVTHPQTDAAFIVEVDGDRFALITMHDDSLEFHGSYGSIKAMASACIARWTTSRADSVSFTG